MTSRRDDPYVDFDGTRDGASWAFRIVSDDFFRCARRCALGWASHQGRGSADAQSWRGQGCDAPACAPPGEVGHIESARQLVMVRSGKGAKVRVNACGDLVVPA